jgi:hypothetical protein
VVVSGGVVVVVVSGGVVVVVVVGGPVSPPELGGVVVVVGGVGAVVGWVVGRLDPVAGRAEAGCVEPLLDVRTAGNGVAVTLGVVAATRVGAEGFPDGVARRECPARPGADDGTTIFSACEGPEPSPEPEPGAIGGRRTAPALRRRIVAAAPSSSGRMGIATRVATIQTERHFPLSLADTGLSSPSRTGLPRPSSTNTRIPTGRQPDAGAHFSLFPPES